jgi:8-oxo-dGTP diphosphatase
MDPLDLVRAFYDAVNRIDLDAIAALYDPDCIAEQMFGDSTLCEGREAVRTAWAKAFAQTGGALAGGHRIDVSRVAGIETGWGWVRADWQAAVRFAGGAVTREVGYTYFWIADGKIQRQRTIRTAEHAGRSAPSGRSGPIRPAIGVGAVVVSDDGRIVLVKRRHEPLAGLWSLPGGSLELGETLEAGTAREVLEETGLVVDVGPLVELFDRILVGDDNGIRFHFVIADYLCRIRGGELRAGGDADAVVLARIAEFGRYGATAKVHDVVSKAMNVTAGPPPE